MEIIVGSIPPLPTNPVRPVEKTGQSVTGRLLNARPTRRGIAGPSGMERRGRQERDPYKGRILTIMVEDGDQLPSDLDSNTYQVHLRLVKK